MKLTETIILAILVIFSLAVAPTAIGFSGWGDGWSGSWGDGWSGSWGDDWSNSWGDGWSGSWGDDDDGWDDDNDDWDDDDDDGWDDDEDWPPYWNLLNSQSILEDSPDNTIVYPNLRDKCIDDSSVSINMVKHPNHYNLIMAGNDLVIRNLEANYWDNGGIVALSCNGVASFFKLTIAPVNDAPVILLDDEYIIYMDEELELDLNKEAYDVDGDALIWSVNPSPNSRYIFDVDFDGNDGMFNSKKVVIDPIRPGTGYIDFRVEDPDGLSDAKTVRIRVLERGAPRPGDGDDDDEDKDRLGIFVSSIRINGNGNLNAGDELEAFISLKNSGDIDLDNVKITMVIQDLAARGVTGSFDLDEGETVTKLVRLEIEEDAQIKEAVYDVRFTISNDNTRRVVYREVDVDFS